MAVQHQGTHFEGFVQLPGVSANTGAGVHCSLWVSGGKWVGSEEESAMSG